LIIFIDRNFFLVTTLFKNNQNGIIVSIKTLKYLENIIINMEKRVVFPKGKQKKFLIDIRKKLELTWPEFAKILNINRKTLEKSYRYEYCSLPIGIFSKISKLTSIQEKTILEEYKGNIISFKPIVGRKVFGEKRTRLPKINISFDSKIPSFDISRIKLSKYDTNKGIRLPNKLTPELAEEIGMHVGDGFLSKRKNEYRLKGNKNNEREYYDNFIKPLYKKLFNIDINIKEYETTYGFEIASKSLWNFKTNVLGLSAGRKDNMEFPEIIKVNDIKILTAFVRGLFDTDGSVCFIKRYKEFGNYYPLITLTLKSKKLIIGIYEILSMLGLKPNMSKNGDCWRIDLNGYRRLETYSKLIGWSNPKNIVKVIKWKNQYPKLGKEVMAVVA